MHVRVRILCQLEILKTNKFLWINFYYERKWQLKWLNLTQNDSLILKMYLTRNDRYVFMNRVRLSEWNWWPFCLINFGMMESRDHQAHAEKNNWMCRTAKYALLFSQIPWIVECSKIKRENILRYYYSSIYDLQSHWHIGSYSLCIKCAFEANLNL